MSPRLMTPWGNSSSYIAIAFMGVSVGFGQIISFIFDTS